MKPPLLLYIVLLTSLVLRPLSLWAGVDSSCTDCHKDSTMTFEESVHGGKILGSSPRIPVDCMSCHRGHGKEDFEVSNTPVTRDNDIKTCGDCHEREKGVYSRTFHGKHLALGKKNVPTCVFCHAGHELPQSNILSPINHANIGLICANCHGPSDEDKVRMATTLGTPITGRVLYSKDLLEPMINGLMGVLTFGVFVFGLLFIMQWVRNMRGEPLTEKLRWPRWLWIQLLFFFIFFILEEQTGLTLFYSSSSEGLIAYPMHKAGEIVMSIVGTDDNRSLIHRLGGFGLIMTVTVHFFSLALSSRLRQCVRPPDRWWHILSLEIKQGIGPGMPVFIVKGQILYWILVVGVVVMVITGIAQWNAFWLMEWVGFRAVRYADIIHVWTGRILVMAVYAILIGYGAILRPIAQMIQTRKVYTHTDGYKC